MLLQLEAFSVSELLIFLVTSWFFGFGFGYVWRAFWQFF